MNASPLFTVATVCLNSETHVASALESVLDQTFGDFEYVVIDGGSTDCTLDIVHEYEPRFAGRLRWQSEPDEGIYDAMNKALKCAVGEFIVFLGADDQLEPGALEAVSRALDRMPRPDIVAGATCVVGPDASWIEPARPKVRGGMPQRAPARHQSIVVRRALVVSAGGFDGRFRIAADYDLYLRLVETGACEVLVPETLSRFRLGGLSSTDALATARDYRDVRVAHGANATVQEMVMLKSALAATLFAAWRRAIRVATEGPR